MSQNCQPNGPELVAEYQKKGFLGPLDVLSSSEVESYIEKLRKYQDLQPIKGDARFKTHLVLPWVNEIVNHPRILSTIHSLLGPNILCWSTDWNIKLAQSDAHYSPHQDAAYAGLHPPEDVLTVWVALTPATIESGPLHFWPGTHKKLLTHTSERHDPSNALVFGQSCSVPSDAATVPMALEAGQMSIHNFLTVHASYPNCSKGDRVGLAIRYIRGRVRQRGQAREFVSIVTGHMEHDGFEDEKEGGEKVRKLALEREASNYFANVKNSYSDGMTGLNLPAESSVINVAKYSWLLDLKSKEAQSEIAKARAAYKHTGAFVLPNFIGDSALRDCVQDARRLEDAAFTTDDKHTAYLTNKDDTLPPNSIVNLEMKTQVASIAYDELPAGSKLAELYTTPMLLQLVSEIVQKRLYLSEDPIGCCSINVFRPGYHHSFHFDESEFSTTLMIQDAEDTTSGLFQYTNPLRDDSDDPVCSLIADTIGAYDDESPDHYEESSEAAPPPKLHTLDFRPGTLSIFSGSKSLHRVTRVAGSRSRLVCVLTFATRPGFRNSANVQKLFWGRSSD